MKCMCNDPHLVRLALGAHVSLHVNLVLRKSPDASILTDREREIVTLVCDCYGSKEISVILGLSVKTVDAHRSNIMRKLHIHDVLLLMRWAIRNQLVSL